jgi:ParB family transcriptional regulator, chromosome partitioning protein
MAFPPSAYTERGGVATVAAANRARWIAEQEQPEEAEEAETVTVEPEEERLAA